MLNNQQKIPQYCDVLVIGGGPAGSSAAIQLAQAGIDVVLLERHVFPRVQVGESLIPHFWKFTDLMGVSEKIQQAGFLEKAGGITVWNNKIHQISFADFGYKRAGLHVERDRFDYILLEHAQENGAKIFNDVVVKKADFSHNQSPKITYTDKRAENNEEGSINCRYIIDASGHSSFLSHHFKNRQPIQSHLKFLSLWGYFKNSRYLGVDRKSHHSDKLNEIAPVSFVLSHQEGWLWHIALRHKTSVGLIIHTDHLKSLNNQQRQHYFLRTCQQTPYLKQLLEPATFIEDSLQFRPDYSYYSEKMCGENYYCIGDAAAFVDPIFSHGVQNAFYNATIASLAIQESLKNPKQGQRNSQLCENRMQQFYSFSRSLALGDFSCNGVNHQQVISLMKSLPSLELELILVAAEMTNRSDNFYQLAKEAGILDKLSLQENRGKLSELRL